jgi:hypothetical protein
LTREANCNAAAPKNEIEAALASQMACAHSAAMVAGLAAQTNFVGRSGESLTAEGVKDFSKSRRNLWPSNMPRSSRRRSCAPSAIPLFAVRFRAIQNPLFLRVLSE